MAIRYTSYVVTAVKYMTLSEELAWRGFINQTTYPELALLDKKPVTFYWGVDPSADSMTVGNLAAAMLVKCFIKHGHKPVLLVGGATGMIGDPDGKSEERALKPLKEIEHNKRGIVAQYRQIFGGRGFKLVDNYDWFKGMGYLEFLRDVGKHVPVRQMLARDFVQSRLGEGGAGISYAEFSYALIQGYDFLHLFQHHGVTLQLAGSDQWGNSIAGVELIRRVTGQEAHVFTSPLVVNPTTGVKFGKSEEGAVWLDATKTSVYKFYQFWLNADDTGVKSYLKVFTELGKAEIEHVMQAFEANKGQRLAQKTLAYEVTKLVHGKARADEAKRATEVLFGTADPSSLSRSEWSMLKGELPVVQKGQDDLAGVLVKAGLASSKTEAMRFVNDGAILWNGQKVSASEWSPKRGDNLVKRGKNSFAVVEAH